MSNFTVVNFTVLGRSVGLVYEGSHVTRIRGLYLSLLS